MGISTQPTGKHCPFIRSGFQWDSADCYLFDIDGTLLNSRDAVHYFAFRNAIRDLCGIEATIDGVPVHGNTDPGILRAVLRKAGMDEPEISRALPQIIDQMCAEVAQKVQQLEPEVCPSIPDLLRYLHERGKLLVAASGNLEPIGWAKLEKAGLKKMFAFGAFSWPEESRVEIFKKGVDVAREHLHPTAPKPGASGTPVGLQATVCVIGDTPSDIEAARALGLPVIGIATGIYSFDDLLAHQPDACIECAADLLSLPASN